MQTPTKPEDQARSSIDFDLPVQVRRALSRDALGVLRVAAPAHCLLMAVEAASHVGRYQNSAGLVVAPLLFALLNGILGWACWRRPHLVQRPQWMTLVPWACVVVSVLQHMSPALTAGSVLFLVATLIGIGPLILATWPSLIATACTAALLTYGCYQVFDELQWVYPVLLTPISLMLRTSRRNGIREAEQRRRLERELATQAAEVENLRRLRSVSGGVAHHFNNLLAVLIGRISVAREEALTGGDVRSDLEAAQRAADRAAQLVRDLQAASQPDRAERMEIDDVEALVRSIEVEPPAGVQLRWQTQTSLPSIWGDRRRIQRAIQHVVSNALESGAENVSVHLGANDDAGASVLYLTIEDDGPGIAEEDLDRVFDPFFTTRGPDRAGLGLAFARSTLEQDGGRIQLRNRDGGGVEVRVDFVPRGPDRRSEATTEAQRAGGSSPSRGSQRGVRAQ